MQLRAFTLIELLVVVFLISLLSFFVINLPTNKNSYTILDLKELTYPNGTFYLYKNGNSILQKDKNKTVNLKITLPEVYIYDGKGFVKKEFNKNIAFKYSQKNGLGDFFILKCEEGIFVFKPLYIKKFNSLSKAKNFYLLKEYQPQKGSFYWKKHLH